MLFIFVCKWGEGIGLGHLSRCFALNESVRTLGFQSAMICLNPSPKDDNVLVQFGGNAQWVPKVESPEQHRKLLKSCLNEVFSFASQSEGILVVDDYEDNRLIELALDKRLLNTLQIRDFETQGCFPGLIYSTYIPEMAKKGHLYGLKYFPVREVFKQRRHHALSDKGFGEERRAHIRALVSMGGVDKWNRNAKICSLLLKNPKIKFIKIVTSNLNPNLSELHHLQERFSSRVELLCISCQYAGSM